MTTVHFDVVTHIKQLRQAGFNQDQAEIQAQAIDKVIQEISNNQELATKQDLQLAKNEIQVEIVNLRVELIKWILSVGIATILAMAGIIKYLH